MATPKQIEANRRNAQKSTGPRTPEGKAISRRNALKTGIDAQAILILGEDKADLEALTAGYYQRFEPSTPEERCLVDIVIRAEWQLRRLSAVEAELWWGQPFRLPPPFRAARNRTGAPKRRRRATTPPRAPEPPRRQPPIPSASSARGPEGCRGIPEPMPLTKLCVSAPRR